MMHVLYYITMSKSNAIYMYYSFILLLRFAVAMLLVTIVIIMALFYNNASNYHGHKGWKAKEGIIVGKQGQLSGMEVTKLIIMLGDSV